MKAYLGVDWSATGVDCSLGIGEEGPTRAIKGAKRTLEGVRDLMERVRKRDSRIEEVHVIIEAGAPGWVEMFHHAGAIVHVVDPKQAKAFAASVCSSGAKDDARDADNLVGMGRSARHLPAVWGPGGELREPLCELGGLHETLTQDSVAAQQRLRAHLRERLPALEQVLPDLTRGWTLRLLRVVPTALHAERLSEVEIRAALEGSGAHETTRAKVVEALRACRAPWLTEGVARVHELHVVLLLDQIEQLCGQIAKVEGELDALTRDMDIRGHLESIGGVGPKMANRLIQFAFDEIPEHRDQAAIQLGAAPVFRGSGKTKHGKPKGKAAMRHTVSSRARATTYLLGRLASQQLAWAKRMYADARQRGQKAALAYRRIARCVLRILTAMARNGQPYDDDRYVAALQAKGVPWASEPIAG